jgi:peptidyl-prolyl cis-trans isomerase SurA
MTGRKFSRFAACAALLAGSAVAAAAVAQNAQPTPNSSASLRIPQELVVYGAPLKPTVKASVLINGEVITQTDVDQRVAMLLAGNDRQLSEDDMGRYRNQVLGNLIDETLEIQAAKHEEIVVKPEEVDKAVGRFAETLKTNSDGVEKMLIQSGSSMASLRKQIESELAWRRLQQARIESGVTVGDEEVKSVLAKLEASKGTEEFNVGEIFLSSSGKTREQTYANAMQIIEALQKGLPFAGAARQYSEASTAAVGGDLGWVRPEQLPDPLAAALTHLSPGTVSPPVEVPGGFSILALKDSRKVLVSDPRDAVLTLKQVTMNFAPGMTKPQVEAKLNAFVAASRSVGGCGGAEKLATDFNGEVVQADQVKLKDLPPALQDMLLPMQIGQATSPFGREKESVRVLVLCGRDVPDASMPTYDQVLNRLNDERVNVRARRYLRDLRRDAIIEFR